MIFNSITYFIFLPIVLLLFFALPQKFRWILLLCSSYFFYGYWNVNYLAIIIIATAVAFFCGKMIGKESRRARRKLWLYATLIINLGILAVFKYWDFGADNVENVFSALGIDWQVTRLDVLLPVGISFFTFQTLSYVIDIYRGRIQPEGHLGMFAVYVAFFPQLVAGPIERAQNILPQLKATEKIDIERMVSAMQLILWGLFKKVVIADRVAIYVDLIYAQPDLHSPASRILATYFFAIQIYCDFSAYSDIAIGSAKLFGIDLMENFRRPYFSRSITEFWRRWHISLSTWLRDYLYIELGGNRRGVSRTYINLMITMLLGGLWHGASWNFVIWGALHGLFLVFSRLTLPTRDRMVSQLAIPAYAVNFLRAFITFQLVVFCWIFFRADTFADALTVVKGIIEPWGSPLVDIKTFAHAAFGVSVLLFVQIIQEKFGSFRAFIGGFSTPVRWVAWYALLFAIVLFGVVGNSQFIYFQF